MSLVAFISICLLAGYIGSQFTFVSVKTWYHTIKKPSWNPPNWIFAPVWTLLYVMMAVAAWRVWENADEPLGPMLLFALQLGLNMIWSAIFFGMRNIRWAFLEITLLWAAVVTTAVVFYRIDTWAGLLFVPYVLWVIFAAFLNLTILTLNR